jgi:hypothetical protein
VGQYEIRKPKKDGWFEHGQNCNEYLELNFGLTPYKPKRTGTVAPPPPMVFPGDHGWMA